MIDLIALSAAKKHADLLAMGLTSVSVDNTNKSITFTLAADGSQRTIYFDQPSDGISIVGIEIKNGHLICLMSDGSEIDAGVLPSGGSGGSVPKPLTYDYMPEGYPKKSGCSIEWNGNTEGLVAVDAGSIIICKVSDLTLTDDELIGRFVRFSDGTGVIISSDYIHALTEDITFVGESKPFILVVKKDNATAEGLTFPQKGTYFVKQQNSKAAKPEPLYVQKLLEVITPMAEEFMPPRIVEAIDAVGGTIDRIGTIAYNAQSTANNAVSYAFYQQLTDEQKEQARTNIGVDTSSFSPLKPTGESYLTFSSPNRFTLAVKNATKRWDGTLEYFTSDGTWTTWNANSILSAIPYYSEYVLYLRGTGNTIITGNISGSYWVLTGTDIKCIGNIENLLDYATVESGAHPTLADYCYYCLFYGCTSLTQAPALLATTLADHCYDSMFRGCTSLTKIPSLPATTLANYCYNYMFYGCTSLIHAPALPATTLANYCYNYMFSGCTSLIQAPVLPATTLANYCYNQMFYGCTSLIQAPVLPATTLADHCYYYMFQGCTSLIQAPVLLATTLANYCYSSMFKGCTSLIQAPTLPATTLASDCYSGMFQGCTSLTQAPALPATTLADHCYYYMFQGCTSLTQAPTLPATTLADYCYRNMFQGCASLTQVPALPATTLANNCYNNMFQGCAGLKLSTTLTNEYTQEYRIPSSGDGTTAPAALSNMFASTGGTFTGTPEINTTYYLSSDNMIVRETDIATLNGYVGSMINTALSKIGVAEEGAY